MHSDERGSEAGSCSARFLIGYNFLTPEIQYQGFMDPEIIGKTSDGGLNWRECLTDRHYLLQATFQVL
jgi:hypothetical protein